MTKKDIMEFLDSLQDFEEVSVVQDLGGNKFQELPICALRKSKGITGEPFGEDECCWVEIVVDIP